MGEPASKTVKVKEPQPLQLAWCNYPQKKQSFELDERYKAFAVSKVGIFLRNQSSSVVATSLLARKFDGVKLTDYLDWTDLYQYTSIEKTLDILIENKESNRQTERLYYCLSKGRLSKNRIMEISRIAQQKKEVKFRDQDIFTLPDKQGIRAQFLNKDRIKPLLSMLVHEANVKNAHISSSFKALWAMTVLLAAHPFTDGNGRVAQFVFNFLLKKSIDEDTPYLPLSTSDVLSNGLLTLSVRRVTLQQNFDYLHKFLNSLLNYLSALERYIKDPAKDVSDSHTPYKLSLT